ncbi:hypothetical protein C0389_06475 [bacterium]|nr:hypothetical protein [bacterium]
MKRISFMFFGLAIFLLASRFSYAQVTLSLPTITGNVGTEIFVPITVNDLTGLNIDSYQFQINYNPAVINITEISITNTLSAGGSSGKNTDVPGRFRALWYRQSNPDGTKNPLVGSGTLLNIKVKYIASGTTAITYGATDGFINEFSTSSVPPVTYTITAVNGSAIATTVNNPPVFDSVPAKNINEGELLSFTVNATDPESLPVTYTTGTLPLGANFNPTTKTFTWTPGFDQAGPYTVEFRASDGNSTTSINVSITVVQVNKAPVFTLPVSGTFTIAEAATTNNTIVFAASGPPAIAFSMVPNTPALTWASFNPATATLTLTPGYGVAGAVPGGNYTITIRATGDGLTTDKVITVTVSASLRNPIWTGTDASTIAAKSIKYNETFNFSYRAVDLDGHVITYSLESITPTTTAVVFTYNAGLGGFGQLVFTPTAANSGIVYTIVVKATCSANLFSTTTTVLTVGVNTPPSFTTALTDRTVKVHNVPVAFTFPYVATDADGDPFTFTLVSGKGSISSTGLYSWTPVAADKGTTNTVKVRIAETANPSIFTETTAVLTVENVVTGVESIEGVPTNFALMQNYPNPFNPSTTIHFKIPITSYVKLSVVNILGEEVAVLVNGLVSAGNYNAAFDATNLPSGLYLYRIQADNFNQAKKMLLTK